MSEMQNLFREFEIKIDGLKFFLRNSHLNDTYEKWRNDIHYDDVFLVSFPKSGNTWVRFQLTGLYLWLAYNGQCEPNYYNIHNCVPDIHLGSINSYRSLPGLPRIIKSHRGYTSNYPRVIYIVRDARDALLSRFHFRNRRKVVFSNFDKFLQDRYYGISSWKQHVDSWLDSPTYKQGRLLLVRYEDMLDKSIIELKRMLIFLGINLPENILSWIVYMAEKDRVQQLETMFGRPRSSVVPFIRKGEKGEWTTKLSIEQLAYIYKVAGDTLERCGYEIF